MSTDLIWPSISKVADAGSNESVVRGFEVELIRQQWDEQKERIFCEDESDMLVECGMISETGKSKFAARALKRTLLKSIEKESTPPNLIPMAI